MIATRDIFLPEGVPENDGAVVVPVIGQPAGQPAGRTGQKQPGHKPQSAPTSSTAPG